MKMFDNIPEFGTWGGNVLTDPVRSIDWRAVAERERQSWKRGRFVAVMSHSQYNATASMFSEVVIVDSHIATTSGDPEYRMINNRLHAVYDGKYAVEVKTMAETDEEILSPYAIAMKRIEDERQKRQANRKKQRR